MSEIGYLAYRPEVDGLRAIAVLAVVLCHANYGFRGGYVGVDVFFVISGFLISSLLLNDLERGVFKFSNFWERRARRIIPALVLVTLVTVVIGWFLLLPVDYTNLGSAAASLAVFSANIYFWRDSGYFSAAAQEKPLLHTWSLAVEEQFYLFAPILLWWWYRYGKRQRTTALYTVAAMFILSFGASVYGADHYRYATFYLLPARVWEFLLGGVLVFASSPCSWLNHRLVREISAVLGLALIFGSALSFTEKTTFPGFAALPPCLGAAMFILANRRKNGAAPTVAGAVLSFRPLTFVGLISYSLYLWHWPLLAFSKYLSLDPSMWLDRRFLILSCSFLLAVLSWKFVELPFRERRLAKSKKSMFICAVAGLSAILICGLTCIGTNGFPKRFSPQAQHFASAKLEKSYFKNGELSIDDLRAEKLIFVARLPKNVR